MLYSGLSARLAITFLQGSTEPVKAKSISRVLGIDIPGEKVLKFPHQIVIEIQG